MRGLFVFVSMSLAAASMAENYSYVQWYELPLDGIQTYGALFVPRGDHTIGWFTATYTGEVNHAQTPEGGSYFAYDAHRGPAVQNAPLNGDLIGIVGGAGTCITLSAESDPCDSPCPSSAWVKVASRSATNSAFPSRLPAKETAHLGSAAYPSRFLADWSGKRATGP
ncbi:MAG: hypothetical protein K1X67_18100 [Fimbriimonadaceae bacterium]|nr:hypothetical protein [Fimbriimonadaceae bacterium]